MVEAKKRIFIVDDDASVRRALRFLISSFGYVAETFDSGAAFMSAVPDEAAGCLVLDIHMPEMDGWEVQAQLTARGSKRRIVFITAEKNGGSRERAISRGAVGFLEKPFSHQDLSDLLKECVCEPEELN